MLFSWSKGQPHPPFGSLRVLIQLTVWVSPRGAGRKMEQSAIRPPSPRDTAARVACEVVRETNKGRSHVPPVRGASHVQVWSRVRRRAAGRRLEGEKLNIKTTLTADVSTWQSDYNMMIHDPYNWHHWWAWISSRMIFCCNSERHRNDIINAVDLNSLTERRPPVVHEPSRIRCQGGPLWLCVCDSQQTCQFSVFLKLVCSWSGFYIVLSLQQIYHHCNPMTDMFEGQR